MMLTLGTQGDGQPFLAPRSVFETGHTEVRGMTRSGKSVFELHRIQELVRTENKQQPDCIIVPDLGADVYLRNGLEELAEKSGKRFREFALRHERLGFDPFQAFQNESNPSVVSAWASAALQLQHGAGYGKGHFSAINEIVLLEAFETLLRQRQEISLQNLVRILKKRKGRSRDAIEAINVLLPLLHYPQLCPDSDSDSIDIADSIRQGDIVYFSLDCLTAPAVARVLAGLVVASAILACIWQTEEGKGRGSRTFLTIDEFSQLVNAAFSVWLTAAGKHGCYFSLLYQSTAQLRKAGDGLEDIVFENCRSHFYFTCVGSEDVDKLREMSSETRTVLGGRSGFGTSITPTSREVVDRALSVNEILDVSATDRELFAVINDGNGHRDPVHVKAPVISDEILKKRSIPPSWMKRQQRARPEPSSAPPKQRKTASKVTEVSESSKAVAASLQTFFERQIANEMFNENQNN